MRRHIGIIGIVLTLTFLLFFPHISFALSIEDEIKTAFSDMLDREPTKEELEEWISKSTDFEFIKSELNKTKERDSVITDIYQRALKRNPREDELEALKRFVAPNNLIREQLFSSEERILAIKDVYQGLLGRDPSESDLEFYISTRAPFNKIKEVLNGSVERHERITELYKDLLLREPTEDELKKYIDDQTYLEEIKKELRKSNEYFPYKLVEYNFNNRVKTVFPQNWETRIVSDGEAVSFINPVADYDNDGNSFNTFITMGVTPQEVVTQEYVQETLENLEHSGVKNIYPVSSETVLHNGAWARDAQYTFEYGSGEYVRYRVFRIDTVKDIYTISIFVYEEKYLDYVRLFEKMVKDWKIF